MVSRGHPAGRICIGLWLLSVFELSHPADDWLFSSAQVRADSLRPASDVRVHIIPGYNVYSAVAQSAPHRSGAASSRDTNAKPMSRPVKVTKMSKASSSKKSTKEVYEL